MTYDIIIPVAAKDAFFVHRTVKYIRKNLPDADYIYIITNKRNNIILSHYLRKYDGVVILDENTIVPGLDYSKVKNVLAKYNAESITGWYFQQFLKLGFAQTDYSNKYYLSWDADTLPLTNIPFEHDGRIIFDYKKEYHKPYFIPIKNIFGLNKLVEMSFIAEHMLFEKDEVLQMITEIQEKTHNDDIWWQSILDACDFSTSLNSFSEFEMYGTYVYSRYPSRYEFRQLATFRRGGLINGRLLGDKFIDDLSFDLDTVSFEIRDIPPFPQSIIHRIYMLFIKTVSLIIKG